MLSPRHLFHLLVKAAKAWRDDYAPSMGAAISYYTVFSIAPLLVIVVAIAGATFGREAVQGVIVAQLSGLMGAQGASLVQGLLASASDTERGLVAGLISVVLLLVGATTVFAELQSALDRIWHVPESQKPSGVWGILRARLLSFGLILGLVFLLMVSLAVSAGLAAFGSWTGQLLPGSEALLQALNLAVSLGLTTVLFAMIYKLMPSLPIAWRDVWVGAFVTALLFEGGKLLIGLYIGKSSVTRGVRGGGLAGGVPGLGLLRGADLPAGRGVHQGLRGRARLQVGPPGHDGDGADGRIGDAEGNAGSAYFVSRAVTAPGGPRIRRSAVPIPPCSRPHRFSASRRTSSCRPSTPSKKPCRPSASCPAAPRNPSRTGGCRPAARKASCWPRASAAR